MLKKITIASCACLALCAGGLARAGDDSRYFYGGIDLGGALLHEPAPINDVSGFTYGAFVGYQALRNLGAEVAYVGAHATTSIDDVGLSLHSNAAEFSAVGTLPLTNIEDVEIGLQAKVGGIKWWDSVDASGFGLTVNSSETGLAAFYGGGLYLGKNGSGIRIEYTQATLDGVRTSRIVGGFYWRF